MGTLSLQLKKAAPVLASVAEESTTFMMELRV
jgi:hypothetical protein